MMEAVASSGPRPREVLPVAPADDKSSKYRAIIKCGQAVVIAAVVFGVLVGACYVTAKLLYDAVPEARQASGNISSHLDLGHIQRGLGAMHTYVNKAHRLSVLLFALVFTIKTTFSIPGATPLCVVAGALFPWWEAVVLCTFLVILGSFFSYNISKYLLSPEVLNYMASKERVDMFKAHVDTARRENRLFWALLALRLFPLTPGSVINTFSPHVNVPVGVFALTILAGNMPYILITTAAGDSLASIKHMSDILSPRITVEFTLLAVISCVPVILKRRQRTITNAGEDPSAYDAVLQEDDDDLESGAHRDPELEFHAGDDPHGSPSSPPHTGDADSHTDSLPYADTETDAEADAETEATDDAFTDDAGGVHTSPTFGTRTFATTAQSARF